MRKAIALVDSVADAAGDTDINPLVRGLRLESVTPS
jgi:hypothetical protein